MRRAGDSDGLSGRADPERPGSARVLAALMRATPALVVLLVAAALLWPVPLGQMPLSADHTVHLTRIALTADRLLEHGSLSGWEPTWFFGFPLGDLYPQLGDLLIIGIRGLSLGLLDWPQAYALGFFVVFALQGLVLLRIGRLFGLGPLPGLIAALLMLVDPGFTREGGWMYTVYFGVWPQALATSLAWLALGELARALGWTPSQFLTGQPQPQPPSATAASRATLWAGLIAGAALLAHPIALPTLGLGAVAFAITLIPRAPTPWRPALARCVLAGLIAGLTAAWWWVPMLQHQAWMASYGWLHAPFEAMATWAREQGALTQRMPAAVGYLALLGLVLAGLGAGRVARFVALFAVAQWLMAATDVFWGLRLDRFSEGFTHIQYQRFLIGAKPGLFLCAGLAATLPAAWARRLVLRRQQGGSIAWLVAAVAPAGLCAAACLWLLTDAKAGITEHEVGAVQVERVPGEPEFAEDYAAFTAWARSQWEQREADYRLAVRAPRNSHWFMDAPVWTATPQYKLGFTPGDNFVHKPESGHRQVLDALGVRWMVARERADSRPRPTQAARFGTIVVSERRGRDWPLVHVQGEDGERLFEQVTVELLEADLRGGVVRARLSGVEWAGKRVVFAIAGYPRWHLTVDGRELPWVEVPLFGEAAPVSPEQRRAGALRGGKARGDDGSEPTLIAAELPPITGDAIEVELRYRQRGAVEAVAELLSLLTLILVVAAWIGLAWARDREQDGRLVRLARLAKAPATIEAGLAKALHPAVLATLLLIPTIVAGQRWRAAAARESSSLLGWLEAGAATGTHVEAGPVKTDMLIRPAVILRPRPGQPAAISLRLPAMPPRLEGWLGLDDDQAQLRAGWARHAIQIQARPLAADGSPGAGEWSTLLRMSVAHEPQRVPFVVEAGELAGVAVELRVVDEARGERLARLGLNLELGAPP